MLLHLLLPWALLATVLLPAAARAEGGMPQLDFANPLTLGQVWWGAVIFIVLYVLLSRLALPRVGEVLEERARHIAADLETAQAAKGRSDAAAKEVTDATGRARAEAQAAINAAKQEAAGRIAALNQRLEKQLQDAESQIDAARAAAMRALREVATETAGTVIARLTGAPPDQARLDGAIGAALAARRIG
jgi:F-type H+-transporting ATPase subunit b